MRDSTSIEKISENEMLTQLQVGSRFLLPLFIRKVEFPTNRRERADALIDLSMPDDDGPYRFVLEAKSRSTPEAVHAAVAQAKTAVREGEWPMILVPYLAPDRLEYLERAGVSGVDLCGNGVVQVPKRLFVFRSGQPNIYPDSRPLNNPYRGRSALVARLLLTQTSWPSLKMLVELLAQQGGKLSMAQSSKAIRALEEDRIVAKTERGIRLEEPLQLLDRLGSEWRRSPIRNRKAFRLNENAVAWAGRLSSEPALRWAVTGESSASRYGVFSQAGPRRIAVSNLATAMSLIGGIPEPIPSFAEVELIETDEPGFFFQTVQDDTGMRWASRLQTWLELQAGDARQKEAAVDLRLQILKGIKP